MVVSNVYASVDGPVLAVANRLATRNPPPRNSSTAVTVPASLADGGTPPCPHQRQNPSSRQCSRIVPLPSINTHVSAGSYEPELGPFGQSISEWRSAVATACVRLSASSLPITLRTCDCTVSAVMPSSAAARSFVKPSAT